MLIPCLLFAGFLFLSHLAQDTGRGKRGIMCVFITITLNNYNYSHPHYPWGIGSRSCSRYKTLQMLKSHSRPSVYMIPHLRIQATPNGVVLYVFIEKYLRISGPAQFKPVFKGQLYFHFLIYEQTLAKGREQTQTTLMEHKSSA